MTLPAVAQVCVTIPDDESNASKLKFEVPKPKGEGEGEGGRLVGAGASNS